MPGHWEGDLIIGLERSAIGTVVERTTRFTKLVHLPREEGYRHKETPKNGPALAGYGALTMKNALTNTMSTLPTQLARSLTWDRGKEMSAHAQFKVETGIPVFFADPRSPWQRGTNENTNGLLRQYFPKGTDLSCCSAEELEAVAHALNTRPRKTLGWKTTSGGLQRAPTINSTSRCCFHRLNSQCTHTHSHARWCRSNNDLCRQRARVIDNRWQGVDAPDLRDRVTTRSLYPCACRSVAHYGPLPLVAEPGNHSARDSFVAVALNRSRDGAAVNRDHSAVHVTGLIRRQE